MFSLDGYRDDWEMLALRQGYWDGEDLEMREDEIDDNGPEADDDSEADEYEYEHEDQIDLCDDLELDPMIDDDFIFFMFRGQRLARFDVYGRDKRYDLCTGWKRSSRAHRQWDQRGAHRAFMTDCRQRDVVPVLNMYEAHPYDGTCRLSHDSWDELFDSQLEAEFFYEYLEREPEDVWEDVGFQELMYQEQLWGHMVFYPWYTDYPMSAVDLDKSWKALLGEKLDPNYSPPPNHGWCEHCGSALGRDCSCYAERMSA